MGLINQWEAVDSIECNQADTANCFRTGLDVLNYYGFKQVLLDNDAETSSPSIVLE